MSSFVETKNILQERPLPPEILAQSDLPTPEGSEFSHVLPCSALRDRKLECGPMPNVMVALPNIGGARCSTP